MAATFREACRARSRAEFISKVETCSQEADETSLWLEIIHEAYHVENPLLHHLLKECEEILAILVTMAKRSKSL